MTPPRVARWVLARALPSAHRRVVLNDLDEEFRDRLRDPVRRGAARRWYRRQALASTAAAMRWRWDARPARGVTGPHSMAADIRFGLRLVRRRPASSLAAVATLAAGIGVAAAVVSISHAVLVRELPYGDPDGLVSLEEFDSRRGSSGGNLSWPDLLDYRAATPSLAGIAGYNGGSRTVTGMGPAERVSVVEVTDNFFAVLDVRPSRGRDFTAADGDRGSVPVVILTDQTWRGRFGADPAVVGRLIDLGGTPTRVVGVLPPDFEFPLRGLAEMFVPVQPSDAQLERRYFHWIDAVARLAPGASLDGARAEVARVAAGFAAIDAEHHAAAGTTLTSLSERIVGDVRPMLLALLAAAVLLLAIACSGVSGLLLARSASRQREMTVRAALGATRFRLVRQLLTESVVLSSAAAVLGIVMAYWLVQWFVASLPDAQRHALPHLAGIGLEPAVVAAGALMAGVATCLASLLPAVRLMRRRQPLELRPEVGTAPAPARLQALLVGGQVALAVILLAGAGLMGRSVANLAALSPGFDPAGLLTMRLTLGPGRYASAEAVAQMHAMLIERITALPGVSGVATINQLPLTGRGNTGTVRVEGEAEERPDSVRVRTVTANYFDVMGIRHVRGRPFAAAAAPGSPPVVLVNETFARTVLNGDAVGRRITFPWSAPDLEIVGIVGDERFDGIEEPFAPVVYFSYGQSPERGVSLAIRATRDPAVLASDVRAVVSDLDAELPVFAVRAMDDILGDSEAVFRRRAVLSLVGVFGGAALLLAVVSLAAVVSRVVAERTREFGLRLTLGARGDHIAGLVLRRGLFPAVAGVVVGLAGSLAFGRALSSLLFGVEPGDPFTLAAVAMALLAGCAAACAVPAWRAVRIDPARALRDG